mmetsp:Transcript_7061/g.18274  ORF Transcript_7061/g.18274 Transcript_7061/m.18274 type:complete len:221 (-) Transcript_7061:199-861(-)
MPTLLLLQALAQAASEAESALKASSAVLTDGSVEMPAEEAGTANNHAEVVAFLPLWIALLLFAAATAALCLCGYFHISLSDMCDDLINPITLCNERVSAKKLSYECGLHAVSFACWVVAWQPIGIVLALPTLLVRLSWQSQLKTDPTTIFTQRAQKSLRWRWTVMCVWHGITVFIGFFQLVVHGVNSLQRHVSRLEASGAGVGFHPMYAPHHAMYMHHAI